MKKLIQYILDLVEYLQDLHYCGLSLRASKYKNSYGDDIVPYQPCRYMVLSDIFSKLVFSHKVNFLDIGCGKGRVLAYLLNNDFPGTLSGVEIDGDCISTCKAWSVSKSIELHHQDIFDLDTSAYNVFFLGHPFRSINNFSSLIQKLEDTDKSSIILIVLVDTLYRPVLKERDGWAIISEKGDIPWYMNIFYPKHLSYSIWKYDQT